VLCEHRLGSVNQVVRSRRFASSRKRPPAFVRTAGTNLNGAARAAVVECFVSTERLH